MFGEVLGVIVQAHLLECEALLLDLLSLLGEHDLLGLKVAHLLAIQQRLVQHAAVDQGEVEGLLLLWLFLGP